MKEEEKEREKRERVNKKSGKSTSERFLRERERLSETFEDIEWYGEG